MLLATGEMLTKDKIADFLTSHFFAPHSHNIAASTPPKLRWRTSSICAVTRPSPPIASPLKIKNLASTREGSSTNPTQQQM